MQDKTSRRNAPRAAFLRGRHERADGLVEIASDCGFYLEGTRRKPSVTQRGKSRAGFSPIWRAIERGLILGAADVLASFTLYSIAMSPQVLPLLHEIDDPMHPRHRTWPHEDDASAPLQPDIEDFLSATVHHHPFLQASALQDFPLQDSPLQASAPRDHAAPRRAARSVRSLTNQSLDLLGVAWRGLRVPALAALMVLAPASSPRAAAKATDASAILSRSPAPAELARPGRRLRGTPLSATFRLGKINCEPKHV